MTIVSVLAIVLLVFLGLVHVYWALGGSVWIDKAIPRIDGQATITPGMVITLLVAIALFSFAGVIYLLQFNNLTTWVYGEYIVYLGWVLAGVFMLRAIGDFKVVGFFKKVTDSAFAKYDTFYYSPLCLAFSVVFAILAYRQM